MIAAPKEKDSYIVYCQKLMEKKPLFLPDKQRMAGASCAVTFFPAATPLVHVSRMSYLLKNK